MSDVPTVAGKNGFEIPIIGFGTWQVDPMTDGVDIESVLDTALEIGYRHFDTAYAYLNEESIGKVFRKWLDTGKIKREELFIVTKLPLIGNRPEMVDKFLNMSLQRLQLDYVDLYLIHGPFGLNYRSDADVLPTKSDGTADLDLDTDLVAVWKQMEEQVTAGKTRWIGVSNFNQEQVERLLAAGSSVPATNQIQVNAYFQRPELVTYLQEKGIVVTSYSTLGSPGTGVFYKALGVEGELPRILSNSVVLEIAAEVGKTPGQVLLRHMIQKNVVVIPKSVSPERMRQNFDILGFELSEAQMKKLDGLNQNEAVLKFQHFIKGVENHPEYPFA